MYLFLGLPVARRSRMASVSYDCPSGQSQVVSLNCLPNLYQAYSSCRQSTSLPSSEDRLYFVLPGFLYNFCSHNEPRLSLVASSSLVDLLSSDICQIEDKETPFFTNFLAGLSDHKFGASFLTNNPICDYLVHHVSLSTDSDSIQPVVSLISELGDNEPFCLLLVLGVGDQHLRPRQAGGPPHPLHPTQP